MAAKRRALAERRKAAGYSQEALAEVLRVEPSTVGRWERGETAPQPWFRPKLARALGISQQTLAELLSEGSESDDPATRAPAVPDLHPDERHHIEAVMADARRYLDADVVASFTRQFGICAADDGVHGPAQTLPTVLGILGVIEQHARDVKPVVRCELLSLGAVGAEFAGWLYRDLHQLERAGFWYSRATEWAQEAGDTAMQGYVLLKKSQMAYDDRDALRVLTLAQAAQYGPWRLSDRIRVEVTQQEARGLAMLGEPLSLVEQKLDHARALLADARPDDESPNQLGSPYDEHTLTLRNASCYIEAGKPGRAAGLYAQVLATDHLSPRDCGYFTARMASSLALAGEPDAAADAGLDAARLAAATASERTKRELMRALATLTPWRNRPGPRALREAFVVAPDRTS